MWSTEYRRKLEQAEVMQYNPPIILFALSIRQHE
jgi:hypothetical protein